MHSYLRMVDYLARGVRLSIGVAAILLAGTAATIYLGKNAIETISAIESGPGSDGGHEPNRVLSISMAKSRENDRAERLEIRRVVDGGAPARTVEQAEPHEQPTRVILHEQHEPASDATHRYQGTYRTLCVRECDGGFFPVSFSTTPDRFAHDAAACNRRCEVPARLFVYPNIGGSVATMVDLDGRPYSTLANADVFRTERRPACACRPESWQQEAQSRHRVLELTAAQKSGDAESSEVALRTAIEEVRRTRPGGLAALTSGIATSPDRLGRQRVGDGEPVIGGQEPDPSDRPEVAVRFAGQLKPVHVVYDATGRAVLVKQPAKSERPAVAIIARVVEVEPPVALSTGSLSETAGVAMPLEPPPVLADMETVRLKRAEQARAERAAPSVRKQHHASLASGRRKADAKPGERRRANVTVSAWYGNRVYTGNDWRLSNYQILE